jgi:hypothetical protein
MLFKLSYGMATWTELVIIKNKFPAWFCIFCCMGWPCNYTIAGNMGATELGDNGQVPKNH